jgi:hypothetical protein
MGTRKNHKPELSEKMHRHHQNPSWQLKEFAISKNLKFAIGSMLHNKQRESLVPGDVACIVVVIKYFGMIGKKQDEEALWVTVHQRKNQSFVGHLLSESQYVPELRAGKRVTFSPQHVVQVLTFLNACHGPESTASGGISKVSFEPITKNVARLTVIGDKGCFGIWQDEESIVHSFGFNSHPEFYIEESYFPKDEEWKIFISLNNQMPQENRIEAPVLSAKRDNRIQWDSSLEAFESWSAGSVACKSMLSPLPPGEYSIIRGGQYCVMSEKVNLGNSVLGVTPPCIQGLREKHQDLVSDITVVGSDPCDLPCLNQPLIGTVILNSDGYGTTNIVFFSFSDLRPPAANPDSDMAFIIPLGGELIWAPNYYHEEFSSLREHWLASGLKYVERSLARNSIGQLPKSF